MWKLIIIVSIFSLNSGNIAVHSQVVDEYMTKAACNEAGEFFSAPPNAFGKQMDGDGHYLAIITRTHECIPGGLIKDAK